VLQNFRDATLGTETIGGVLLKELGDEVLAVVTHVDLVAFWVGEVDSTLLDHLVHLFVVITLGEEGRASHDHFVGQDSDGPPVDGEAVTRVRKDLRGQIVGCSAEGVGLLTVLKNLSQSEISEAEVTILIHQDVFRLKIAVNNFLVVEVSNSKANLDGVEPSVVFREARHSTQVREEFSSSHKPHHEEDLGLSLEHVVHTHEEGVVSHQQNIFLQFGRLDLIVLQNNILSQSLHSVNDGRIVFLDHQKDLTEGPTSDNTFDLKVL